MRCDNEGRRVFGVARARYQVRVDTIAAEKLFMFGWIGNSTMSWKSTDLPDGMLVEPVGHPLWVSMTLPFLSFALTWIFAPAGALQLLAMVPVMRSRAVEPPTREAFILKLEMAKSPGLQARASDGAASSASMVTTSVVLMRSSGMAGSRTRAGLFDRVPCIRCSRTCEVYRLFYRKL